MAAGLAGTWQAAADPLRNRKFEPAPDKFTFVRVQYDSVGGMDEAYYFFEGRLWYRWETDYPEAEQNLLYRLRELTNLQVNPQPIALRLTDEQLFEYPFIYMCDVGWQLLTDEEVKALRAYLERGGFLWADDFWGEAEWWNFRDNMERVFPEYEFRDIPNDHPIVNIVYPLEGCPQIPAKSFWEAYGTPHDLPQTHREPTGGIEGVNKVNFKGIFDPNNNNRLMVVASHNSDIGDGWEREGEERHYFERFSVKSYAIAINIITYALTH